jgi:hypothetical protein
MTTKTTKNGHCMVLEAKLLGSYGCSSCLGAIYLLFVLILSIALEKFWFAI